MLSSTDTPKTVKKDADEAAEKAKGLTCESLQITFAENGFAVREHFKPTTNKKDMGPSYMSPDEYVFESVEDVLAFVKGELTAHAGGE